MGLPNQLIKYELEINLIFPDASFPEKISPDFTYFENFLSEKIKLCLKENGFVTFFQKIFFRTTNSSQGFQFNLFLKLFNISFVNLKFINQSPSFIEVEKIEDLITKLLVQEGLAPKIEIYLNRLIKEEMNELITSPPSYEGLMGAATEDHFHLVIPNKSGFGFTSVYDIGGQNEHYHIVREFEVSPAMKNGKEIDLGHKHSLPRFEAGFYSTSGVFYGDDEMVEHKHENIYLDVFGNGFVTHEHSEKKYNHTHRIVNGIIYPAQDIEGYHMHRILSNLT